MPVKVVDTVARHPGQQPADNETIDVRVQKLKLVGALNKAGVNVDVTQVITDGNLEDSMTGAPQLIVDLLDRGYRLLQSGVFNQPVDVELDKVPFRLVEPALTDVEVLELTFEHKLVALLRQHKTGLKANRATTTRAQFIETMLREIAADMPGLTFVCPELNTVQPVAGGKQTGRALVSKTIATAQTASASPSRSSGFGLSSLQIRYWDGSTVTLGPSQLQNAAIILQVCQQQAAPPKATLAVMEACLVEPDVPYGNPAVATDGSSIGILQVTDGTASAVPGGNRLDVAACVQGFLTNGYWIHGGAIHLAQTQPGLSAGQIAQDVQGSAFGSRYDQAQTGAQAVIQAFAGTSGSSLLASAASGASASTAGVKGAYEFSRGQPGQQEDSWTCMQRLASEVNWRCFVAGRATVYFVTDDDLLTAQTTYRVGPDTPGLQNFTFQLELGARTIIRKGKRVEKPSEAQLDARFARWEAPPGSVIELEGYGPADDRWIVNDITRPLFDASGTITLEAPQKPGPEPAAPTTATSSGASGSTSSLAPLSSVPGGAPSLQSSNPIDRVYAAAQWMDARNLPYVYGGGHVGDWQSAIRSGSYDCSSSVSVVLYLAGMMNGFGAPIVSGDFSGWGQAGKGTQMTVWYTSGHVFIEFYGRAAKRFDTVPGGSGGNGPHLRGTAPGDPGDTWEASGFAARHWPGL